MHSGPQGDDYFRGLVINLETANEAINAVNDPVLKTLLRAALGALAYQYFAAYAENDLTPGKYLPTAPFDTAFYVQLVKNIFSDKDAIKRVLEGELNALEWL